jgi:hypothetical protein
MLGERYNIARGVTDRADRPNVVVGDRDSSVRLELLMNGLETTCNPWWPKAKLGAHALIPMAINADHKSARVLPGPFDNIFSFLK